MQFRLLKLSAPLLLLLALAACGNPQEEARMQLGRMKLQYNEHTFVRVAQDGDLEAVQVFLRAGMKPNVTDKEGQTALLAASRFNREAVAKVLLAAGADPNIMDARFGASPLQWAALNGFPGVVKLLLDKGADVQAKDRKYGMTALMFASREGKAAVVEVLLQRGAAVNAGDSENRTALTWAARKGHAEVAKLLLDKGADPKIPEKVRGWNALITAADAGKAKVVKVLLDRAPTPTLPTSWEKPP